MKLNNHFKNRAWVIRAGKVSEAQDLFLNKGVIALEDEGMGDLKILGPNREAFYEVYKQSNPDKSYVGVSGSAGKFFRFLFEIEKKDMAIFPSRKDNLVYIGFVEGKYVYSPNADMKFPHQRKVTWDVSFDKASLSLSAKRELGTARTFFEYKRNINEILSLFDSLC